MVFESVKKYKGYFWKKLHEEEMKELPTFKVEYPQNFSDLPTFKNISETNVRYPLIIPFANAHIVWNPDISQVQYLLEEPEMSVEDEKILSKVSNELIDMIQVGFNAVKDERKIIDYLEKQIMKILNSMEIKLEPKQMEKIMYYIYRNFVGLNRIEPLLRDPWIEDIACDGVGVPLYVVHRKYGSLQTNIVFNDLDELREFVIKLAERCGRYVSYAEPILDGSLPDGSRVNASLAGDVTTKGPTFSIRKFSKRPFSPIEIIELGTASSEIMAYFWYLMENGASILIAGGVATGKTTFLNAICMFIPPEAKIVSIEDTRELRIPHEHWVPTVTRLGFGIPMVTGEKYGEITLFDLLKGSFRQNPDYVIVGEVRGKEAYVMFQGMSSGHPSLCTFHAGSIDTVIKRLTTPPIELPATLVESLDVVAIIVHAKEKGKSARRIKEIEEIKYVDPKTLKAVTYRVAEWDPQTDKYKFFTNSFVLNKIAKNKGIKFEDAIKDVSRKKNVLDWMLKNNIKDFEQVNKIINDFYKNPEKILKMVENPDAEIKVEKAQKVEVDIEKEAFEKREPEESEKTVERIEEKPKLIEAEIEKKIEKSESEVKTDEEIKEYTEIDELKGMVDKISEKKRIDKLSEIFKYKVVTQK